MLQKPAENCVIISGVAADAPEYSHSTHNVRFFTFGLESKRLSGATDVINITAEESILSETDITKGCRIRISGELRSYNNKNGEGPRLVIYVFAKIVEDGKDEDENEISLCGCVCKPPVYRFTPLGREICDMILAVTRKNGKADYLPCIAWGENARACSSFITGDRVCARGRVQSRQYIKNEGEQSIKKTAYEVSLTKVAAL